MRRRHRCGAAHVTKPDIENADRPQIRNRAFVEESFNTNAADVAAVRSTHPGAESRRSIAGPAWFHVRYGFALRFRRSVVLGFSKSANGKRRSPTSLRGRCAQQYSGHLPVLRRGNAPCYRPLHGRAEVERHVGYQSCDRFPPPSYGA